MSDAQHLPELSGVHVRLGLVAVVEHRLNLLGLACQFLDRPDEIFQFVLGVQIGRSGKTLDQVGTQDVFAWHYGVGLSCRQPSSITIGARLACVSSFYRFLIRMTIMSANPCDQLERPRTCQARHGGSQPTRSGAAGWSTENSCRPPRPRDPLDAGDDRAPASRGDEPESGNILVEDRVYYTYRGKGGKTGKRELPPPAIQAIYVCLAAASDRSLVTMAPDDSLWPDRRLGRGITSGTFYTNLRR